MTHNLRKYSSVNQAMQMVSTMLSRGFSIKLPSGPTTCRPEQIIL